MKTSWKKILEFAQVAQNYLANHPEKTKLEYAITRVMSQTAKIQEDILEKLADVDIDYCMTEGDNLEASGKDSDKIDKFAILRDDLGNLKFSKQGWKNKTSKRKQIINEETIDIEPYFATAVPDNLSLGEKEIFVGFVLKDIPEPKEPQES